MTKQRHCFVAQVGDAIEKLASALDPERKPPFKGDILDLLEWAERDVLEMRAEIANLNQPVVLSEWQQLQNENAKLRQQVILLRNTIEDASQIIRFEGVHYYLLGLEARDDALDATKEN